jgi:hypothetical protein
VDLRAGLHDLEKRKFLTLPGLELRPLGRPARSQSLYQLRSPGSKCFFPRFEYHMFDVLYQSVIYLLTLLRSCHDDPIFLDMTTRVTIGRAQAVKRCRFLQPPVTFMFVLKHPETQVHALDLETAYHGCVNTV